MKDGKPFLAISVAGGDMQDQAALQIILDVIDFGMDINKAMTSPRFSTRHFIGSFGQDPPKPGSLRLNDKIDPQIAAELTKRGHKVSTIPYNIGGIAMLYIDANNGQVYGAGAASAAVE
jgi:gamma-glutamyltranspeptidase/glutathione hydrolase